MIKGPIVRLGPNRYSVNDAEATRILLGHTNALDKSRYYIPFGSPTRPNIFTEPRISAHKILRRPITALYSTTSLLSYECFVDTCNKILVNRLREYALNDKELDMRQMMQFYAFDVIGEITAGFRFGFMEDDGDKNNMIAPIDETVKKGALLGLVPEVIYPILYIAGIFKIKPAFQKVIDFAVLQIHKRTSGHTKSRDDRQDFIDKLLPLELEGRITRMNTVDACGSNIGAGSDTTAISLTATFAYLAMNPKACAKLRDELDKATSNGTLSDPVTFQEAQRLPYLHAVIYESLRIHSAVGAPLTRVIGKEGATLVGQYFPPGTEVGVNPWVAHYNTEVFGPDAAKFVPERWLTDDAEKLSNMNRNFLAFGAGPRTCLGKNISLLEMFKVVPQVMRNFDFEIVADKRTAKGYAWKTYWFTKQDCKCRVVERRV
ncbi:unnamed protein product [Alternaria alternata]